MKRVSEPNNSWALIVAAPRTKNRTVEIPRSKVRSTNAMHLYYHNFNAFCSINDIVKRLLLFSDSFDEIDDGFIPVVFSVHFFQLLTHTHTPIYIVIVWILIAKLPIWMVLHKSADWFRHLCLSQRFKFFTFSLSLSTAFVLSRFTPKISHIVLKWYS